VSCVTSVICTAVGDYFDANAGEHALFESYAPPGLVLGPPTLSWSVSLGGYDLSASSPVVLDVDNLGNAGWDLTIEASGLPSNGSEELASPTLNGSSSSSGATTAPQQSCVGSCTSASGNTVTYPLAIPVGVPADLYNAAVGTGTGELALATYWWVAVPADTYASVGAYSAIVTLTVSSGP
jgi:hypothetical protein